MPSWLERLWRCALVILLCGSFALAADLVAGQRAYQEKDYATAFKELTPLAEKGNPDAQLILGKMYFKGQGVLKDLDQAIKWFKASAEQGNADAQFFLGSIYLLPHTDVAEGVKWLRLSAEQGNQDAQLLLGKTYIEGLPPAVPRDAVQAEMWLWLAARDNLPFYQNELAAAERQMSNAEMQKGRAQAAAWKPKHGLRPEQKPASDSKSSAEGKSHS